MQVQDFGEELFGDATVAIMCHRVDGVSCTPKYAPRAAVGETWVAVVGTPTVPNCAESRGADSWSGEFGQ